MLQTDGASNLRAHRFIAFMFYLVKKKGGAGKGERDALTYFSFSVESAGKKMKNLEGLTANIFHVMSY